MVHILRRIVHNDAIKLDPDEVYNWRVFALACAACFGGTLFGVSSLESRMTSSTDQF